MQDVVILRDMSGGGRAESKGYACSPKITCIFLCERLMGQGRKMNSNLDGRRKI